MRSLVAVLAVALAGCAAAPAKPAVATMPSDCAEIEASIRQAEHAQREAERKRNTAWKAVIPFAIAARHASGSAASEEAGRKLAALRAENQRRCAGTAS